MLSCKMYTISLYLDRHFARARILDSYLTHICVRFASDLRTFLNQSDVTLTSTSCLSLVNYISLFLIGYLRHDVILRYHFIQTQHTQIHTDTHTKTYTHTHTHTHTRTHTLPHTHTHTHKHTHTHTLTHMHIRTHTVQTFSCYVT